MNILFLGDIFGKPGRKVVKKALASLQKEHDIAFTIANAENAASGRGLTADTMRELLDAGIDVLTMGNHVWDNKDIMNIIDEPRIVRPANYPGDCPGQGYHVYTAGFSKKVAIINLSGRVFMPSLDCPFKTVEEILAAVADTADYIIVDFHAEATSEKAALGYYLDGRTTAVLGTHTHIQTADEKILPSGTAYITDLGMTGPYESILGVDKDLIIKKFLTQRPVRFEVARGPAQIQGVVLKLDDFSSRALSITRINLLFRE